MSISRRNKSDIISSSIKQYLSSRDIQPNKLQISLSELASLSVVENEISIRNLISFSAETVDHASAETQYTKFKVWISESPDHYKPELAQLLYPVFTHLYIRLLVSSPPSTPGAAAAHRFHKRHLSTFQGNPEFKQFIHQLGEVNSVEELDQTPAISTFRSSRYSVTLTVETYSYLLRYLEKTQCNLILTVLNQEVDVTIGDPLGAGSRQDTRASLSSPSSYTSMLNQDADPEEVERLEDLSRRVRGSSPTAPSISLYRIQSEDGVCVSGETDIHGKHLVSGCEDGIVRLWHTLPSESPVVLDTSSSSVRLGCISPGLTTSRTIQRGRCRTLKGHTGTVYSAIFLPDHNHIVSVSEDTTVRIWDKVSGAGLTALHGHMYPVWCAASDSIGVNFVTGSMDRTARLWRPEYAHPLRIYAGHEQDVDCVSFHPNCLYLMSGSCDRTVRLWHVEQGRCVRVLNGHKGAVSAVQISPCGEKAASAGEDKKIRIWDLAMGKQIKELRGHTDTVTSLVWGDSRLLCSGGLDGSLRVWDVDLSDEELLETYPVGATILGSNFTETNTLVTIAQDTQHQINGS